MLKNFLKPNSVSKFGHMHINFSDFYFWYIFEKKLLYAMPKSVYISVNNNMNIKLFRLFLSTLYGMD